MTNILKFSVDCPCRTLFAEIADKWSMMILTVLEEQPRRFNDIKKMLEGVSQKSLTQTLRRLERNGIVNREVLDTSPIAVEYSLTELGHTLIVPFKDLYRWTKQNFVKVEESRASFDKKQLCKQTEINRV